MEVPAVPGVYALWRDQDILYVGQSTRSVRGRVISHMRQLAHLGITRVTWRECARPALEECLYIWVLDPPLNSTAKERA